MPDQKNTRKKKRRFLEFLEKRKGIVSLACLDAGIDRKTFYNWEKKDKIFEWKAEEIRDHEIGSIAEDNLANAIIAGDAKMTMFYLRSRNSKYRPKLEQEVELELKGNGLPPPIVRIEIINPPENEQRNADRPFDTENKTDVPTEDSAGQTS